MRCALRDVEEEDIAPHFEPATAFLRSAFAGGGKVLGAMPQSMCLERGVFCLLLDQHLDVKLFSQEVSQGRMCMWTPGTSAFAPLSTVSHFSFRVLLPNSH